MPKPTTADTLDGLPLQQQAAAAAESAAKAAGVEIVELDDMPRIQEAADLFSDVWRVPRTESLIPANTLRALGHSGNYLFGAYEDERLLGAIVGFLGRFDGDLQLHSHILGVADEAQGRRIGFALKQHQRAWALAQELSVVTWTFDPLVRKNSYFNIGKLGATMSAYYPNFYGVMSDGINDEESDRVLVEWHLGTKDVVAASEGHTSELELLKLQNAGGVSVLEQDVDGAPVRTSNRGPLLLVEVPEDIVKIRAENIHLATRWRLALRDAFEDAFRDGYVGAGMTRSGWFVLRAPDR